MAYRVPTGLLPRAAATGSPIVAACDGTLGECLPRWRPSRLGTAPASAVRRLQEGVRRDSRLALLPLVRPFYSTVSDLASRRLVLPGLLSGRWVPDLRFLPLERQPPIVASFSPLRLFGCPTRSRKSVSRNKATALLFRPCLRKPGTQDQSHRSSASPCHWTYRRNDRPMRALPRPVQCYPCTRRGHPSRPLPYPGRAYGAPAFLSTTGR